jgi:D-lactate dehydrogenase
VGRGSPDAPAAREGGEEGRLHVEQCGKVHFFEMEEWGIEYLREHGLKGDVTILREPLSTKNAAGAAEAEILSVFVYSRVDAAVLDSMPRLKLVATRSTGHDHIDQEECARRGIAVCNVPRYGENTVAEHAFGLILALSRRIYQGALRTARLDFRTDGLRGFDLKGKTLGVLGAGAIGLHLIRMAKGFGMEVLAYDARPQPLLAEVLGFRYAPLDEVLSASDVVSIHLPLIPETRHLINDATIRRMKRGAILVNTARGAIVDTRALVTALNEGILGGAGLDVLEGEESIKEEAQLLSDALPVEKLRTLVQSYTLLNRDNVLITPHVGFYSREAEERIMETTIENIRGFCGGKPQNLVLARPAGNFTKEVPATTSK